ncbi:MAG: TnsA endonuclease N-terminal domain-containing protein [Rhodospirillales bacterium]|nr:TnsA endonuclease N-terminal domain-containing protein [Rhodospirillales bacterium]
MTSSPRSREVVRPTTHRYVGRFSSVKNDRMVHWESKLERDQIVLLEIDPDVVSFFEQPTPFYYEIDGKPRKYTPDFLVRREAYDSIIEVKPSKFAESAEWSEHLRFLSQVVTDHGFQYVVATEREIQREPRLRNAKRILRYRGCDVDQGLKAEILAVFDGYVGFSITGLENEIGIDDLYPETCALIAKGHLCVDLDEEFSRDALIRSRLGSGQ